MIPIKINSHVTKFIVVNIYVAYFLPVFLNSRHFHTTVKAETGVSASFWFIFEL